MATFFLPQMTSKGQKSNPKKFEVKYLRNDTRKIAGVSMDRKSYMGYRMVNNVLNLDDLQMSKVKILNSLKSNI